MKQLLLALSLLAATPAFAKNYPVTGEKARTLMEALATAGFAVKNIDKEWGTLREPISVATGPFVCHFNALYPDGWMANVTCHKGKEDGEGAPLGNPLALAQAIKPYAFEDAGLGNRWLFVENASCALNYNKRQYRCVVSAPMQQE